MVLGIKEVTCSVSTLPVSMRYRKGIERGYQYGIERGGWGDTVVGYKKPGFQSIIT